MRSALACLAMMATVTVATLSLRASSPDQALPPGGLQIFLLAGQSNMAGRGEVAADVRIAHPRVWMFDQQGRWRPAIEPMHFDKPIAAVGPGRAFGVAIAEADPGAHIGLVPTAVGGSPITAWEPGGLHQETGTHPWDDAVRRMTAASSQGTLRAILWHQGESDGNDEAGPRYEARLRALIARFRGEFGQPDLPFLIGQLGQFSAKPWTRGYHMVDAAQQRVAADTPGVAFVSSDGLGDKGDLIHFSAGAARDLGRRYAQAYLKMTAR